MVQGVSYGRRHRSPQDSIGKRKEGSARTRSPVSRRASLLDDAQLHVLWLGVSKTFPPPLRRLRTIDLSFPAVLLLHIYCIYDSDMTHGGPQYSKGFIGVESVLSWSQLSHFLPQGFTLWIGRSALVFIVPRFCEQA
jgi:hypothetical protein